MISWKFEYTIFLISEKKPSPKTKDGSVKKKKPAEELVDRVFRKTGGGFGVSYYVPFKGQ